MTKLTTRARPRIPEPVDDDPKEIYAFFGLAAYSAQLLEQGLLNLLVGVRILGKQVPTWGDVRGLYEEADQKSLGQLLKTVGEATPFDPALVVRLDEALKKRNYLIHHFFVDHSEDLLSTVGRRRMIDELREIIALFKAVDPQVDDLWLAIWSRYGFSEDRIQSELRDVKRLLGSKESLT
jgi:hypothetical protein